MSGLPIYQLVFSTHAIKRMFERSITKAEIRRVLVNGEVINEYLEDKPYPSQLILGWSGNRPLHVVVAMDVKAQKLYIVTVYDPDLQQWEPNLRRKKL
jgi:Domain of unknown function (DUF4258)